MNRSVRMTAMLLSGAAMLLGSAFEASATGALPDGVYDCGGGYRPVHMGKVDIKGDQFRYRPYDKVGGDFAPYSAEPNGAIHWAGHFGALDDPPARIVESTREAWGFNVKYQGSPGGLTNTMSCHAPGK
jgi:hypothetical protein